MTSIIDNIRDLMRVLCMDERSAPAAQSPMLELPRMPVRDAHERHLACSMQQLHASLAEVSRIVGERPELAREWRSELLECGRGMNFAISQATSRMRTLGEAEQFGRAP